MRGAGKTLGKQERYFPYKYPKAVLRIQHCILLHVVLARLWVTQGVLLPDENGHGREASLAAHELVSIQNDPPRCYSRRLLVPRGL